MSAFISTTAPFTQTFNGSSCSSRIACPSKSRHFAITVNVRHLHPTAVVSPRPYTQVKSGKPSTSVKTMQDFWNLADESKVNAQYEADSYIAFLKEATLEEIRSICLQYRFFVERYPDNLSMLLSKLPNQQLKSLLSSILAEELGSGDISGSHIVWYDRFLRSLGVNEEDLENGIYDTTEDILSEIEFRCQTKSFEHGVGLVGMGGECLCQIYLTVMYRYLRQNPAIKQISHQIDWEFWTYHVGEEDIEHRRLVRECIDEMTLGEKGVMDLASGYSFGKSTWDRFWASNYRNTRAFIQQM